MKKALFFFFVLYFSTPDLFAQKYKDVAPILYSRCTSCHNQYGHQNLVGYTNVKSEASQILAYLNKGLMPPWLPDLNYTHFMHERYIAPAEKTLVINWIRAGCTPGDTLLAPPPPNYSRFKMSGTPDLILKMSSFSSNADTSDAYDCFSLPTGLTQDRFLYAYEVVPGNPAIIHHITIGVDTMADETGNYSGFCYNDSADYKLGSYIPGMEPTIFPNVGPLKLGIRIKAGSNILLQMHYPAGSKGQIDSSQIRLFFYPVGTTGIREVHVAGLLSNWSMNIPANSIGTYTATYPKTGTLVHSFSLLAVGPHAHYIDSNMLIYAYDTAKDTIPIMRIKNWNYNVQQYYMFHHLVRVPFNYIIYAQNTYNNTSHNPNNPFSPPRYITSGFDAKHNEMFLDSFEFLDYLEGDEKYNLDSLLALTTAPTQVPLISSEQNKLSAFPNPGSGIYTIESSTKPLKLIEVYNCLGQLVYTKETERYMESLDLSGQPAGIYILKAADEHLRIIKE